MSRTVLLIAGALTVVAALAIGGLFALGLVTKEEPTSPSAKTSDQTTEPPGTTQTNPTPSNNTAPSVTVPKAREGQTADTGDSSITLNALRRNFVFPNNNPKPEAGDEFILMNITISNKGPQPLSINMGYFLAEDSNGVRRRARYAPQLPDPIPDVGSLAPGEQVTGNLVVEAPRGDPNVKLLIVLLG